MNAQLLIVDLTASSLLVVDGLTNAITAELPLPPGEAITDLCVAAGGNNIFLPAAGSAGKGALYVCNLSTLSLYRLPVSMAHPACFALCGNLACFADPVGRLYLLDTTLLTIEECKSPLPGGRCAALASTPVAFLSLWENDSTHLAASMNLSGELTNQCHLPVHRLPFLLAPVAIPMPHAPLLMLPCTFYVYQQKTATHRLLLPCVAPYATMA